MFASKVVCPAPASASAISREDWWRCLFEQTEDAQVVCDVQGRVVEANRRATQLLGIHAVADGQVPYPLLQALTPATGRRVAELLKCQPIVPETLTAITLICEGHLGFIADLQLTPLSEEHALVTLRDASRRWRMESHVQRLMTAIDATSDVVFLTDAELKLAFVNAAFQNVTGHTIEDALGRTADFLRAPSEREKVNEYLARVAEGADWKGELINLRSDGTTYPVESVISPIFTKKGVLLGYAAFERDISLHKRLQDELRCEHSHVLSIINSLDAAVYTVDRQFRLSHTNDGWKKMPVHHGWLTVTEPPAAGVSLLDYVLDQQRKAELTRLFEEVLTHGQAQEIRTASLDNHQWSMKIAPWFHEGAVRGLIYVVTDQTKYHQLQQQLYQAQKMETIGALAAGVAHDFNNLLQAIHGNVGLLLLEESIAGRSRHCLQQIDQAAVRAADITQQLLSFSRATDETVTVLDFNQVLREASSLALRSLSSKVELVLRPMNSPAKVRLDATRAQQLLLNLCINALDAMPNGGQLTLSTAAVPLSHDQAAKARRPVGTPFVRCSVADTGVGIPPEYLTRIFNPFFTTKAKDKGTGLGLAIVQGVVDQAGGFIEVVTAVDQGTTFHVSLPMVDEEVTAKILAPPGRITRGTGRILVVDDLDLVLDFTRTFLLTVGYEVLVATSGEEALKTLESLQKPVDLLFTDYNMSGMNGWELICQAARRWPQIKAILASGYLDESERSEIEKTPAVRVLDKPFHMRDAANLIAEMLASSPTHPPSGISPESASSLLN
jgi:two-component system, cell cycle sensor histidine kinase and response regulator CckA